MNSIILKKYVDIYIEKIAAGTIVPGMLLELTSADKVQAHSNAGQDAVPYFAIEDALQGKGINNNYAVDDRVRVWVAIQGSEVYAWLADGENASIGSLLESDGNGRLRVHTADSAGAVEYPLAIVAQAIEAKNLSGSSGGESSGAQGDQRIKVRIT